MNNEVTRSNETEKFFLTLAYNRFYNLFEEIMNIF